MIDLDLVPPPSEAEVRPSLLTRLRARLTLPRPATAAVLLLAVLATLGGATPPPPVLTEVMAVGGTAASAFVLGRSALFTAMFGATPNSQAGVRRFSLADGSAQWTAEVRHDVQNLKVSDAAHVLMARSGSSPQVTFLDTDNGKALWRNTSTETSVLAMVEQTVLLVVRPDDGPERFQLADLRTGRILWSRDVGSLASVGYGSATAQPTRIVTVSPDGRAVVLGFADGTVRAAAELGVRLREFQPDGTGGRAEVTVVRDRLYVAAEAGRSTSLAAYDADTLTPLWRTDGGPIGMVDSCGIVVCVVGLGAVTGVDPATGTVLWRSTGLTNAFAISDTAISDTETSARPRLIGYLRRFGAAAQEDPDAVLLDPATGRVLAPLGHSVDIGGLMLRADKKITTRSWVTAADRRGVFRVVGTLDTAAPYGCSALGSYLACPTSAGPTTVWRVPR